jgi:lambda repressor-like predicted transcriptional regulator
METRKLKMICTKSKQGHSLSQISELTGLTIDQVKETLGQTSGLTLETLINIFHMKQRGLDLERISQETGVELEVLKQILPQALKKTVDTHAMADQSKGSCEISLGGRAYTRGSPDHCKTYSRSPPKTTEETKQPPLPTKTLPKPQDIPSFDYCCQHFTNKLHRVNLLTGEQSCHKVPNYKFRFGCRWSELPGGSLLITGGGVYPDALRDVVKIDTLREYAASSQPPMHSARRVHAAVYHSQYLYVLLSASGERPVACPSLSLTWSMVSPVSSLIWLSECPSLLLVQIILSFLVSI